MAKEYVYNDKGEPVDLLELKNQQICENLLATINDFKEREKKDKFKKFGFMLLMQIENELGKYGRLTAEEFTSLTADDIEDLWWHFHSLMAHFNLFFEIVPNRQSFMLYARINSRQYKQLMESKDDDIISVINFIEDRLIGKGFSAGESGNANDKAVMNRMSARGDGHGLVKESEGRIIDSVSESTPTELKRRLSAIMKGEVRQITNN